LNINKAIREDKFLKLPSGNNFMLNKYYITYKEKKKEQGKTAKRKTEGKRR